MYFEMLFSEGTNVVSQLSLKYGSDNPGDRPFSRARAQTLPTGTRSLSTETRFRP